MKTCPRCNHEVQEDQTACPLCGMVFAKWNASKPSSPTPMSPPVPATGKFTPRYQKYLGFVLVILGLVLPILWIEYLYIGGWLVSGIGLALYAKGSGRSPVWGLLALLLFVGPLIGLLAFAGNKKPESKTGMSDAELKWNVLLYAGFLVFAVLLVPRVLWTQIFLKEIDTWSVLTEAGMSTMFELMVAPFMVGKLLWDIGKARVSPGWRKASAWLAVRAVLVGLVITIFWFGGIQAKDVEHKADALVDESLGRIKPGMERAAVHELILEANAALVPKPHALFFTSEREESAYEEVRNALKNAQTGTPVNFKEQKFNRIFFNANKSYSPEKDPEHREIFIRGCCSYVLFEWTRYDLFVEYDRAEHLKSVRYLKSLHEDGQDRGCHVRLEIPASKDKQYPYPCPPDVQDF